MKKKLNQYLDAPQIFRNDMKADGIKEEPSGRCETCFTFQNMITALSKLIHTSGIIGGLEAVREETMNSAIRKS